MFFRQKQSRKKVSAARTFCAAALVFPGLTQYSKVRKTQTEFFTGVYTVDITLQDFERAQQRLKGVLHHTELDLSATFSAMTGGNIYLKYENSQKTGSFKIRGASNKIAALVERGETGAVVASSAGNHAQGVAYAAHRFGIPATIVMPKTAPIAKAKATEGYGATVVLAGDCYDDAYAKAREICEQEHATFLHPYNDPEVIAGQGTLGLEILGDLPTADVVIVPAGGGNMIVIPNQKIASSNITNYSMPRKDIVISIPVGVAYDSDLDKVERVTLDVAKEVMAQIDKDIEALNAVLQKAGQEIYANQQNNAGSQSASGTADAGTSSNGKADNVQDVDFEEVK